MADPSSLWAQPDMLQTFSVTVMPSGHLASEDLQSFDYVLFTSEPAEESASDLTVFVTKRLDLSGPAFVLCQHCWKGPWLGVGPYHQQVPGEIAKQQQSAFDQSDAIAGQLTIFCDLAAPRPAPAARPASATDK